MVAQLEVGLPHLSSLLLLLLLPLPALRPALHEASLLAAGACRVCLICELAGHVADREGGERAVGACDACVQGALGAQGGRV